jgi:hypothetical protein
VTFAGQRVAGTAVFCDAFSLGPDTNCAITSMSRLVYLMVLSYPPAATVLFYAGYAFSAVFALSTAYMAISGHRPHVL